MAALLQMCFFNAIVGISVKELCFVQRGGLQVIEFIDKKAFKQLAERIGHSGLNHVICP